MLTEYTTLCARSERGEEDWYEFFALEELHFNIKFLPVEQFTLPFGEVEIFIWDPANSRYNLAWTFVGDPSELEILSIDIPNGYFLVKTMYFDTDPRSYTLNYWGEP
jgi:hypothetical protein